MESVIESPPSLETPVAEEIAPCRRTSRTQVCNSEGRMDAKTDLVAPWRSWEKVANCCSQSVMENGGGSTGADLVLVAWVCALRGVRREEVWEDCEGVMVCGFFVALFADAS